MASPIDDIGLGQSLDSKTLRAVFDAQSTLLEKLVSATRPPYEREAIDVILREATRVSLELSGAEHGSLILFDSDGQVSDSLLARGDIQSDNETALIKRVLKEGLAGWVAREHKIGLVEDTRGDSRWLMLPDQPYEAGSALCLPIVSAEMLLGVLTLTHSLPGYFTAKTAEPVRILATQMALIIENANLFGNLSNSLKALGAAQQSCELFSRSLADEMNKCRNMQLNFLPGELPHHPDWEMEGFFFPANRISGDFYDAFELPGGYLGLVIGDVCDKGLGAALFMALFRSLIRIFSGQAMLSRCPIHPSRHTVGGIPEGEARSSCGQLDAIRAVALTNDYIAREHGNTSMFATLFLGILDPESGRLIYINGGHEPLFLLRSGGIKTTLRPTGPAVGLFAHREFAYKEVVLQPGDILYGYTDGVIDALSHQGERFTRKRLKVLLEKPAESLLDLMGRVGMDLFAHIGKAPQEDDITMLVLRRKPL